MFKFSLKEELRCKNKVKDQNAFILITCVFILRYNWYEKYQLSGLEFVYYKYSSENFRNIILLNRFNGSKLKHAFSRKNTRF